ncbi:MAG: TVP38/TMEM64 family protein [Syntrophobacter sp.]
MKPTSISEKNWARFKIIILALFVVLALLSIRFTRVGELFSPGVLRTYVDAAGLWAPLAFILFYSTGVCLFVPGTLLTGIGAAIFGPYLGFVYVWLGAMVGSSAAFFIGRTLGRDFAASLVGERLKRFDEAIARNGFAAVLYLRLIYFPFSVMNFGMGLTAVRFLDYFLGTALGILAGTFIFTFFIGNLVEIWTTGNWGQLISYKVFFSIALFVLSLFIPKAVKKIRGEP